MKQWIAKGGSGMMLSVEGLSVRLPTAEGVVQAISDMSFQISAGESLVLVGESGCGKSVLAHALLGLLPPYAQVEGRVRWGDVVWSDLTEPEMESVRGRSVALIPQSAATALNPVRTIEAQVRELARARGIAWPAARDEFASRLAVLGLDWAGVRKRYPHQLSGGMLQRIVNAAALLDRPALVVADEPTSGMDPELVETTAALLGDLPRQGAAVLVITHDLQFAKAVGGRIGLMYGSHLVELRDAAAFFAEPLHPYGRGLLGALPENGLRAIPGGPPSLTELPAGCPFAPRCTAMRAVCREVLPQPVVIRGNGAVGGTATEMVRCLSYA